MDAHHNMEARETRFKTKVHLSNSIHVKLQQMQTDAWEQKADEWLAAGEKGHGDEYKRAHVHYLIYSYGFGVIYIVPEVLQIMHFNMYSFLTTPINLNTTLFKSA